MQKKYLLPIIPQDNLNKLPSGSCVKSYEQYLSARCSEKQIIDNIRRCFVNTSNLTDALLVTCFCFGGDAFLRKLENIIQKKQFQYIRTQVLDEAFGLNQSPLDVFSKNVKKFAEYYPMYYEKVLPKFTQSQSQSLFKQLVQQCPILNATKIRRWEQNRQTEQYRHLKRKNEKSEVARLQETIYLLFAKSQNGTYNVGIMQIQSHINSQYHQASSNIKVGDIKPVVTVNAVNTSDDLKKGNKSKSKHNTNQQTIFQRICNFICCCFKKSKQ